jgi:hypothetical protein
MPFRPRVLLLTLPFVTLAVAMLVGCGSDRETTTSSPGASTSSSTPTMGRLPTRDPDIGGTITSLTAGTGDQAGSLLVEAPGGAVDPYTYDRASLTVPADAPIGTCGPGDGREYGSFGDLTVGSYVVAWIDGPVAESYPVQATAAAVALVCG